MPQRTATTADRCAALFRERFRCDPSWIAAAPGRVNLIGDHVDYNEGLVFPMAIEPRTFIAAAPHTKPEILLYSAVTSGEVRISLEEPLVRNSDWADYVRGVAAGFLERDIALPGFQAMIDSDVPMGSGLSSSAALEVAAATLLEAVSGRSLPPLGKAVLCQRAEQRFAGVPCGLMDQFASVMAHAGHAMLLDCRSNEAEHVPLPPNVSSVMVVNTKVRHDLKDGGYARRRVECEEAALALHLGSLRDARLDELERTRSLLKDSVRRRARHVITEIGRTAAAAQAARSEDWERFGALMYESHQSLRDDYSVSCPELDIIVEAAKEIGLAGGVFGCRMTGAGFGGCAVCVLDHQAIAEVARHISKRFGSKFGFQPGILVSRPGSGAEIVLPNGANEGGFRG